MVALAPFQVTLVATNASFCFFSLLVASVRLYRTVYKARTLQIHDIFLLFALTFGITEAICQCVATKYGLGLGNLTSPNELVEINFEQFYKINLGFFISYFACNMFVKLSLLAFYRKLSPDNKYTWVLWTMAVVSVGFGVGGILSAAFSCMPLAKLWTPELPGSCINIKVFYYSNSAFMIANDIVLYILPIIIVRGVQLSKEKAAAMNMLFALGFIVVIASGLRVVAIYNLFAYPAMSLYYQAKLLMWCTVENHLALIIICLPACRAALVAFYPALGTASSSLWSKAFGSSRRPSRPIGGLPYNCSDFTGTQSSVSSTHKPRAWFSEWSKSPKSSSTTTTKTSIYASRGLHSSPGNQPPRHTISPDEIELRKDVYISVEEGVDPAHWCPSDAASLSDNKTVTSPEHDSW